MNMVEDWQILRRALFGAESLEARMRPVTSEEVRKRVLLKFVDRPVKIPDGRVLVLRRRPAENSLEDAFWVEEITPQ